MRILDLILSYFIGLLTFATPWLIRKILYYKRVKKPFMRFWASMFHEDLVIITAAEEKESVIKSQIFDFWAIIDIGKKFDRFFHGRYDRHPCNQAFSGNILRKDLLLVSGPIPNEVTKKVLDETEVRYIFNGHDIEDKMTSNVVAEALIKNKTVTKDYGIIVKCANPFAKDKHVIITAGCYGWGTWAALKVLADPNDLALLLKKKAEYFQVLVSVSVFKNIPQSPILEIDTFVPLRG